MGGLKVHRVPPRAPPFEVSKLSFKSQVIPFLSSFLLKIQTQNSFVSIHLHIQGVSP